MTNNADEVMTREEPTTTGSGWKNRGILDERLRDVIARARWASRGRRTGAAVAAQVALNPKLPGRTTHCPASRPGRSGACRRFGGRRARVVCAVTKPGRVGIQGAGDRLTGCLDAHPAGFRRAPTGLVAT